MTPASCWTPVSLVDPNVTGRSWHPSWFQVILVFLVHPGIPGVLQCSMWTQVFLMDTNVLGSFQYPSQPGGTGNHGFPCRSKVLKVPCIPGIHKYSRRILVLLVDLSVPGTSLVEPRAPVGSWCPCAPSVYGVSQGALVNQSFLKEPSIFDISWCPK